MSSPFDFPEPIQATVERVVVYSARTGETFYDSDPALPQAVRIRVRDGVIETGWVDPEDNE